MDPVTHGLTGALLAEAGFAQRLGTRGRVMMTVAAIFPDIDIVYRIQGLPSYIENHRALSHSFVGLVGSGLIFGLLLGRFDEEKRYVPWIAAMLIALFSHQILDLVTSYGTVVLYPFSNTRFYFDWVFIIDLFLSGTLLAFLIAGRMAKANVEKKAKIGLCVAAGYIAFCGFNHSIALHQIRKAAEENGISYRSAAAIPQPFLPLRWSGILDAGAHYYQVPFFNFARPSPPYQIFTKTTGSFYEQKAKRSEMGELYFWFARYPVVEEKMKGNFHIVEFSDLRFYIRLHRFPVRKPFVLLFRLDQEGKILESRFTRM